jgi:flavin reductase (DIM6/NTAB) family NADH-FMN oxidoreductase RutF
MSVSPIGAQRFRKALSLHAAGVAVITGVPGHGRPAGLTATSFTSASLDPPLVSFYVAHTSTTWPELERCEVFAVNLLTAEQADLAARFAGRTVDRFAAPTRWHLGPAGAPILDDAVAHIICTAHETIAIGDHWLVVGLVVDAHIGATGIPLLYHGGRFGRFHAASS